MLNTLGNHIRICLHRAAEAKRLVDETADPQIKANLVSLEQSWNCLAEIYQFSERLERFLLENGNSLTYIAAYLPKDEQ